MANAVEDIVFLGKRLKGIIELSDKLTTQETLENNINELKGALSNLKVEAQNMRLKAEEHSADYTSMVEAYKKNQEDLEFKAKETIDNSNEEASKLIANAHQEVSQVLNEGNIKASCLDTEIEGKKSLLNTLNKDIETFKGKLLGVKNELALLKSKF